jgi:peptide/nickel transport system substrate-binding protein
MAKSDERRIHPYIPRLVQQLEARRVDRREFLRTATLLGMSSAAAYGIAGKILGENLVDPALAQSATPKQGGILRIAMEVQKMDDPAT